MRRYLCLAVVLGVCSAQAGDAPLVTESEIELPDALGCARALEVAIHAHEDPNDILTVYPGGWWVVPAKRGKQTGAYFFQSGNPAATSFSADPSLKNPPSDSYMEFWGDEAAIQEAAKKGKRFYDKYARGAFANFLMSRMDKTLLNFVRKKQVQSAPEVSDQQLKDAVLAVLQGFEQFQHSALGQHPKTGEMGQVQTDPNRQLLEAVASHFSAVKQGAIEEVMDITAESLRTALEKCEAVKGDDRVSRLAKEYRLFLQKQGKSPGPAGDETGSPRAGSAR